MTHLENELMRPSTRRKLATHLEAAAAIFVEHPVSPLSDADRDAFLALVDDDSEPNDALCSGAEWFKSLGL